jgi:hypothetical protein
VLAAKPVRWLGVALAVTCLAACSIFAGQRPQGTEDRDIELADHSILSSLATEVSPHGRSLCISTPVACVGPDRSELALSLLAARNTRRSLRALAALVRFQLDGGIAEDYDNHLLSKSRLLLPVLAVLSPSRLHERCEREFNELIKRSGPALGDVPEGYVCRSTAAIRADIAGTVEAIRQTRRPN